MSSESDKIAARNAILCAKNHYEVMSLERTCEEEGVKKRHRELVRMVHPDKLQLGSDAENQKTQQAFRAVQVAYETLSVPHKRQSYDLQLSFAGTNGSRFVPGESNSDENNGDEDAGPSLGAVLLMLVQILASVTVYVANEALTDLMHILSFQDMVFIFSAKAFVLQLCSIAFVALWWGLGWGFLYTWGMCGAVFSLHALVGIRKCFIYIAMCGVLQAHHWNKKGGVPLWLGLGIFLHVWTTTDLTWMPALGTGLMSGLTILISLLMPHMLGPYSFPISIGVSIVSSYYLSLDVFFAIFIADVAWHFLQGLPSACLGILGLVLLYVVYVVSTSMCLFVLAVASLTIGPNYMGLLILTSLTTFILAVYSWGWYGAICLAVWTWGLRRTFEGSFGGKRMALSVALVWCLNCGWISGTICVIFICFMGEVLHVAQQLPTPGEASDETKRKAKEEGSPSGAAGGANKKKDKSKKK